VISGIMLALLLIGVLTLTFTPTIAELEETCLYVYPHITWVHSNQTFTIDICVSNVIDLSIWQIKLRFNESILTCIDVIGAAFVAIENDYILAGSEFFPPFTGNVTLCQIIFEGNIEGISPLHFSDDHTYLFCAGGPLYTIDGIVKVVQHEIALTKITPYKTIVGQGYNTRINVTIENKGYYAETFNVTTYANTIIVQTLIVHNLTIGNSTTLTFTWNTTGFAKGNYTLTAYAWPVQGETDTTDNTLIDGVVYVGIPGDVNGDGYVEMMDYWVLSQAYGSQPGDPNWNPYADIYPPPYGDDMIEMMDYWVVSQHYGEHHP